jgi:predicted dehydrogenase
MPIKRRNCAVDKNLADMNADLKNDAEIQESGAQRITRREFVGASAAVAATLMAPRVVRAAQMAPLRVGLIGCGGRGTGAARDCVNSAPNVELVALGDLFKDRLDSCRNNLKALGDKNKVTDERCFVGFDAYQKVINSGVDLVMLTTPPGFRPLHIRAAIEAGKHVFAEKPVAVDPAGVRSVIAAAELAAQKNIGFLAGTQYRHHKGYMETIKRVHEGAIGDLVAAHCYYNTGGLWMHPRQPGQSDMEWQCRNWYYFTWLSGDHIVEQHVHNLDVMNWALKSHPLKAMGMGGRQVRTDPTYGNIYDHFTIEYEYPNGVRVTSMCRQMDGCATRVEDHLVGTKGTSNAKSLIRGENAWRFEGEVSNPYVQEHADFIASIRAGKPLNEGVQVAHSSLTAIMGRMSAYTGQEITWEQALNSRLDLVPKTFEMGPLPIEPVAIPGKTKLL